MQIQIHTDHNIEGHEALAFEDEERDGREDVAGLAEEGIGGELDRRANQLARFLRRRGVRRGDCVGLWVERSMEAYVALLGILKAGAAYVPLDPEYPVERVRFILSDCQARALVTSND